MDSAHPAPCVPASVHTAAQRPHCVRQMVLEGEGGASPGALSLSILSGHRPRVLSGVPDGLA